MDDFIVEEKSLLIGVLIGLLVGITATLLVLLLFRRKLKSRRIGFQTSATAENTDDHQIHGEMNQLYGRDELERIGLQARAVFKKGNSCGNGGQCLVMIKDAESQTDDFDYDYAMPWVSKSDFERERNTYQTNNHVYENEIHAIYQNIFKRLLSSKMETCQFYENTLSECDKNTTLASKRKQKVRKNGKNSDDDDVNDVGSTSDNSDSVYVEPNAIKLQDIDDGDGDSDSDEKEEVDGKLMDYVSTLRRHVPKRSASEFVRSPRHKKPKVNGKEPNMGGYIMMEISPGIWQMINTRQRKIARAQSNPVTQDDDCPYLKMFPITSHINDETYIEVTS